MNKYDHKKIEQRLLKEWASKKTYKTGTKKGAKKYYVLDMFPYPSGAGIHVGHPRGYIASDIFARVKRMQGYNVLHPMGFDSFGLPAEQYAIKTGKNPGPFTDALVKQYKKQLEIIGFSYDWDKMVSTHDSQYYKWTQWIFLQIYNSWYDKKKNKARSIKELEDTFSKSGNSSVDAECGKNTTIFSKDDWKKMSGKERHDVLMNYRIAYEGYSEVNWCEELGTVLANDEIIDGPNGPISERGEHPVTKKVMRQWFMRITAYAERLLAGLDGLDWNDNIKEIQRNWIGKSEGSEITFHVKFSELKLNCLKQNIESNITIEFPKITDASAMCEIVAHGWLDNNISPETGFTKEFLEKEKGFTFPVSNKKIQSTEKKIKENPQSNFLAKIDNKIVGWLGFEKHPDKKISFGVYIHPEYRGRGIGTFLMNHLFRNYYDYNFTIEVAKKNTEAIKLYKKLGFEVTEDTKWFQKGITDKYLPISKMLKKVMSHEIKVFTTRADTLFGVTYVVLAPENTLVESLKSHAKNIQEIEEYVARAKSKDINDRTDAKKEKTGVEIEGVFAINPANGERVTVWIADYVLDSYGTGAVMAVPSHDKRDFEFAEKYGLEKKCVIEPTGSGMDLETLESFLVKIVQGKDCYLGEEGKLINSGDFDKLPTHEARVAITKSVGGHIVTKYKMRDAIFARQRYWGEPIPLVHKKDGTISEVKSLPLKLPNVKSFAPSGTGESPLAAVSSWVKSGYETNTMPGWAGSSWYFLRYMDPKNKKAFADKKAIAYWKDVDMYVGGQEHATGHLLYSRFWHKFLKDMGYVPTEEPFKALRNQGMILGPDNRKMSKRWGNVINPDDVIKTYGADTLRVYESFMGPFDQMASWNTDSIMGPRRFLERVWRTQDKVVKKVSKENIDAYKKFESLLQKTTEKVSKDISDFSFNTVVSALMILQNEIDILGEVGQEEYIHFIKLLAPIAPFMTEEIWKNFEMKGSIHLSEWPKVDAKKILKEGVTMGIQINGKVRSEITVDQDASEESVKKLVLADSKIISWIEGKEIKKFIYVKGRIINIVVSE